MPRRVVRRTARRAVRRRRRGGPVICIILILIAVGGFWVHNEYPDLFPNLMNTVTDTINDSSAEPQSGYEPESTSPVTVGELTEAVVERVVDGDTLVLASGERVRFIGVDAPEIGEPGADEATEFVRERTEGRTVWLEPDGNDLDRFGRLRRYIWLELPTDSTDEEQIRTYMLNALLLEHGLAEVAIFGVVRNEALFRQIEEEAAGQ